MFKLIQVLQIIYWDKLLVISAFLEFLYQINREGKYIV